MISDHDLMAAARKTSLLSRDETKVGCVVADHHGIVARGFNDLPAHVGRDIHRLQRPEKYFWTEHAERNAIYFAARSGIRLHATVMAMTWYPCADCARAIIQSGIGRIVCGKRPDLSDPKWGADFARVERMLEEGGVPVRFICDEP